MQKITEHTCPECNGAGYPVVMQPVQPGRKIYPLKCKACGGKGKITEYTCPECNGAGYPVVLQPVQSGHRIYPLKCKACDGKGKMSDTY